MGNFPCVRCPENSVVLGNGGQGATSLDSCICVRRYYKNETCVVCVPGGNCTEGELVASDGFWRPSPSYEEFVECVPTKACQGGGSSGDIAANSTNATVRGSHQSRTLEGCNPGYSSLMCAYCDIGNAWNGSGCVTCTGPNVGLALLTLVFVGYVYWTVGAESIAKLSIFVNYLQLLAQSYVVSLVKFLLLAEFNWITASESSSSYIFPFE